MKKIKFNFKDAPWSLIRKKFSFLLNKVMASAKCLNHQNIHLQTSLTKKLFQDVRTQCEKLLEATPFSLLPNPSFCTFLHSTWEEVPRKYMLPTSNMNNICTLWMSSCMKQIFLKTTSIINPFAKFHVNPKQIVWVLYQWQKWKNINEPLLWLRDSFPIARVLTWITAVVVHKWF